MEWFSLSAAGFALFISGGLLFGVACIVWFDQTMRAGRWITAALAVIWAGFAHGWVRWLLRMLMGDR